MYLYFSGVALILVGRLNYVLNRFTFYSLLYHKGAHLQSYQAWTEQGLIEIVELNKKGLILNLLCSTSLFKAKMNTRNHDRRLGPGFEGLLEKNC